MIKTEALRLADELEMWTLGEPAAAELRRLHGLVAKSERNEAAQWMMAKGYATGHGDTIADLLAELEWQIAEREREACAKVCEELRDDWMRGLGRYEFMGEGADYCADAIRARSEK